MGLLEKLAGRMVAKENPGRDISVVKVSGRNIFCLAHDSVGCRDYQLKGTYSYDKVMELNTLTGGHAGFGYCKELGPVAFIGAINPRCVQRDGYFRYKVQVFGDSINDDEYFVKQYSHEDAQKIANYTVFGFNGIKVLNGVVPFEKIDHYNDWRYRFRNLNDTRGANSDILSMSIKLCGAYDCNAAKRIAFGSTCEPEGYSGEDVPIRFAIVDEVQPVGIMNMWMRRDNVLFQDVWGPNEDEPKPQRLRFLDDSVAKKVKNFRLYYYLPVHSFGKREVEIEKMDRTMYPEFDFTLPDGTDYRLQEC